MKNLLILTFFLILGNHCFSQGWNLNTTWVYESDEFGPPIDGNYLVLKVKRDTQFQGHVLKVINATYKENEKYIPIPFLDVKLEYNDRKISILGTTDSLLHLVYDFNLEKGERFLSYCNITQKYMEVIIDSTSMIYQNNIERKVQYVHTENFDGCYLSGAIIEGVGTYEYLLPRYTFVDPPPGGQLICYNDGIFSWPETISCDTYVFTSATDIEKPAIFPNPVKDIIYIRDFVAESYKIINTYGSVILNSDNKTNQINIEYLPAGLYCLVLKRQNKVHQFYFIKASF
ncbi:MAG: T9SS type A sorting domain-containing protein [Saprospiraceae bacterium]|jgi:hypothetical protein|nr:T9SS type A sorting domain-containing protein [Saprospiraceae bacterium]MBP9194075.1 T9SS type A sorting domain-containing protein [Saprospiraceae bacterium]